MFGTQKTFLKYQQVLCIWWECIIANRLRLTTKVGREEHAYPNPNLIILFYYYVIFVKTRHKMTLHRTLLEECYTKAIPRTTCNLQECFCNDKMTSKYIMSLWRFLQRIFHIHISGYTVTLHHNAVIVHLFKPAVTLYTACWPNLILVCPKQKQMLTILFIFRKG